MTPRRRIAIGLAAVVLTAVGIGVSVWRGTALEAGEMVLGTALLSVWVLWPALFQLDRLRTPRFDGDATARLPAVVVGCAAALAWTEAVRASDVASPSWGYATAPVVVLAGGWLSRRALRGAPPRPAAHEGA